MAVVFIILYIIILVVIGYFSSRGESKEGFLLADRKVGFWQMLLSRAAGNIGAGTFITLGAFSYQYGWSMYAYVVGVAIGYILFAWFAVPKILKNARTKNFYTIGDMVYDKLQHVGAKQITDALVVLVSAIRSFVQIIMGALIISHFGGISYGIALVITGAIVGLYLILGGFKAILRTDMIQLCMIVGLGLFVGYISFANADIVLANVQFEQMEIAVMIGFLLYGVFEPYGNGNLYQLSYSAKTISTARKAIAFGWIPTALVASMVIFMGFAVRAHFPAIVPDTSFLVGVENFLSPFWISLAIVMLFASLMSSLDSIIYGASSHLAFLTHPGKSKETIVSVIRWYIFAFLVLMVGAGFFLDDVIAISIIVGAINAGLLPIAILSILGKKPRTMSFFGSIICASLGMGLGIFLWGIDPKIFITILLGGGLGLLVRKYDTGLLLFKRRNFLRLLQAIPKVLRFKYKTWKRKK